MKTGHKRVLVLNADFRPLGIISWRRAVVLSIMNMADRNNGAEVISYYDGDIIKDSKGREYTVPAVIRTAEYVSQKNRSIPFSRKNVFIRDKMQCQYCGKRFKSSELTYDHVIPRAKWKKQNHKISPTTWNNIVTSCIKCNRKKANRTPKEARMSLVREPKQPDPYGFILGLAPWDTIPDQWRLYLTSVYKNLI